MTEPLDQDILTESMHEVTAEPKKRSVVRIMVVLLAGSILLFLLLASSFQRLNNPPAEFPADEPVTVGEGMTVADITELLEEQNVVSSAPLLYFMIATFFDATTIKASTYVFDEPLTSYEVAKRLTEGDFDTDLLRLTLIEGEPVEKFAERAAEVLPNFDQATFLQKALTLEGMLFPETYFIPTSFTEDDLIALLMNTFTANMQERQTALDASSLSQIDVIILASIIEREANTKESKQIVASVLLNRLEVGMPLQADASIEYILDKPLSELVPEDLKIDSPYNTYLYAGLPPTPIGNPGLDAIDAVLYPVESDYFYYITDEDGVFHYSETYNEHLRNIETYLR